jgi:hypothetical protein
MLVDPRSVFEHTRIRFRVLDFDSKVISRIRPDRETLRTVSSTEHFQHSFFSQQNSPSVFEDVFDRSIVRSVMENVGTAEAKIADFQCSGASRRKMLMCSSTVDYGLLAESRRTTGMGR